MQNLFQLEDKNPTPKIDGLQYVPNFITSQEEEDLIHNVDQNEWDTSLKRRVQHYGYKYDYSSRRVEPESYLGDLPDFLKLVAERLKDTGYFNAIPDQCIINEYMAGQGISDHIDCVPCFDHVIASLTLGSGAIMQFKNNGQKEEIYLEPRSLVLLSGKARYEWTHGIPARKSDIVHGIKTPRDRRISLTFRNVLID